MDHRQFQEWLSCIDGLSEAQKQQAQAVLLGEAEPSASLAAIEARSLRTVSARIVVHWARLREARLEGCAGINASLATRLATQ